MMNSREVVVGIPTFKRPQSLRRLLKSLAQLEGVQPTVLVADNEGQSGAGHQVVAELLAEGYPHPMSVVGVEERGLVPVRNALIETAFSSLGAQALAMVDDDERVEPQWLLKLVEMRARTNADVVGGAVYAEFETDPPAWSKGQSVYWGGRRPAGLIDMLPGSGNILLNRTVLERFGAYFDPRFSLSGGEDKEFFVRLKSLGAVFAYAPEAVSHEWVGKARARRRWAIARAFRIGSCDMLILRLSPISLKQWSRELSLILGGVALGPCIVLSNIASPAGCMRGVLMFARQAGKMMALLGKVPSSYRVVHGD